MTGIIGKLNQLSFKEFPKLFSTLSHKNKARPEGIFRATFIGPVWLRVLSPPTLSISGMHGWWGKQFFNDSTAYNLVHISGETKRSIHMQLSNVTSALDGKPALGLIYPREAPFPWRYIIDELRWLDPNAILGMTHINNKNLQNLAFPFLLEYQDYNHGL